MTETARLRPWTLPRSILRECPDPMAEADLRSVVPRLASMSARPRSPQIETSVRSWLKLADEVVHLSAHPHLRFSDARLSGLARASISHLPPPGQPRSQRLRLQQCRRNFPASFPKYRPLLSQDNFRKSSAAIISPRADSSRIRAEAKARGLSNSRVDKLARCPVAIPNSGSKPVPRKYP